MRRNRILYIAIIMIVALFGGMLPVGATSVSLTVTTEREQYQMEDNVPITATLLATLQDGSTIGVPSTQVAISVFYNNREYPQYQAATDGNGVVAYSLPLINTPSTPFGVGQYTVVATASGGQTNQTTFTVVEPSGDLSSAPVENMLSVAQNPTGTQDSVSGDAGAVAGGATVNVYIDAALDQASLIGSTDAGANGAFGPVAIGDNAYADIWVTSTEPGKQESDAVQLLNDIVAPVISSIVVDPAENVSTTRPANITVEAEEAVSWEAKIMLGNGLPVGTAQGQTASFSWAPPSGLKTGSFNLLVRATDAAGNIAEVTRSISVYNYPLVIVSKRVLDLDGNEKTQFLPGQFYQVEVTFANLGPNTEDTLAIIKTTQGAQTLSLGTVKTVLDDGQSITLSVGAQAPANAGTYQANIYAWNMWPSQAAASGQTQRTLSNTGNLTFQVSQ